MVEAVTRRHLGYRGFIGCRRDELAPRRLQATELEELHRSHSVTLAEFPQQCAGTRSRDLDELVKSKGLGEILAHIAGAQFFFCSSAAGEDNPNSENFEETRTSKAAIMEALEMGFGYCDEVFAGMSDADGPNAVTFFGNSNTAAGVLAFNSAHNYEHYGNLVTYMRMNGITPPSSM